MAPLSRLLFSHSSSSTSSTSPLLLLFIARVSLSLSIDWSLSLSSRFYVYEWDSFVNSVHAHRCTSRRSRFSTHRLQSEEREREGKREWLVWLCMPVSCTYTFHTNDSTYAFQAIPMTKFKTSRCSDSSSWPPCRRRRANCERAANSFSESSYPSRRVDSRNSPRERSRLRSPVARGEKKRREKKTLFPTPTQISRAHVHAHTSSPTSTRIFGIFVK